MSNRRRQLRPLLRTLTIVALSCSAGFVATAALAASATAPDDAAPLDADSNEPLAHMKGDVQSVTSGDGAVIGWAADQSHPDTAVTVRFYVDTKPEQGGASVGAVLASAFNLGSELAASIPGQHGYRFTIPSRWRDGNTHTLFAYVNLETSGRTLSRAVGNRTFKLQSGADATGFSALDASCITASSRCSAKRADYLEPNFGAATDWSDGINYFDKWHCKTAFGFDQIERLNILPLGTFGPHFQKDSLAVNWVDLDTKGNPIIGFTATAMDRSPRWSLKKAIFDYNKNQWGVFSVLDSKDDRGGVSSGDGRGKDIVFNDYSLLGWGPASVLPGSATKVPGVSTVSLTKDRNVYPLYGSGPLGLSTIIACHSCGASASDSIQDRSCVHMNPKLMDYDQDGVPHTLLVNLWRLKPGLGCDVQAGGATTKISGNYFYRYKNARDGWQLDLAHGIVPDPSYVDDRSRTKMTPKLYAGSPHQLIAGRFDGVIEFIDPDRPSRGTNDRILDCSASKVHFAEAAGGPKGIAFLAAPDDMNAVRHAYGLSDDVNPVDIYYLTKKAAH